MFAILLGVPGQLKTLINRLTSTWAAKLDTLHDTRITSLRAGYLDKLNLSGKCTDDAVWTNARAGYLDKLNTGVTGAVKSIQTGYLTPASATGGTGEDARYRDVTITAVSATARCFVKFESAVDTATGLMQINTARLTSTTNLRLSREHDSIANAYIGGRWTVVEYY